MSSALSIDLLAKYSRSQETPVAQENGLYGALSALNSTLKCSKCLRSLAGINPLLLLCGHKYCRSCYPPRKSSCHVCGEPSSLGHCALLEDLVQSVANLNEILCFSSPSQALIVQTSTTSSTDQLDATQTPPPLYDQFFNQSAPSTRKLSQRDSLPATLPPTQLPSQALRSQPTITPSLSLTQHPSTHLSTVPTLTPYMSLSMPPPSCQFSLPSSLSQTSQPLPALPASFDPNQDTQELLRQVGEARQRVEGALWSWQRKGRLSFSSPLTAHPASPKVAKKRMLEDLDMDYSPQMHGGSQKSVISPSLARLEASVASPAVGRNDGDFPSSSAPLSPTLLPCLSQSSPSPSPSPASPRTRNPTHRLDSPPGRDSANRTEDSLPAASYTHAHPAAAVAQGHPVLCVCAEGREDLLAQCQVLGWICCDAQSRPRILVTELAAREGSGRRAVRSLPYMQALLCGLLVVGFDWLEECLRRGELLSPYDFEVQGCVGDSVPRAPLRARCLTRGKRGEVSLLRGYVFTIHSDDTAGSSPYPDVYTRQDVVDLIEIGGGKVEENPLARLVEGDSASSHIRHINLSLRLKIKEVKKAANMGKNERLVSISWLFDAICNLRPPIDTDSYLI